MRKKWLRIVFGMLVLFIICSFTIIVMRVKKYENLIYPGVYIGRVYVGGMSKVEAENKLSNELTNIIRNNELSIKVEESYLETNYKELGISINCNKEVDNAFAYGKNLSFLNKHKVIYFPKAIHFQPKLILSEDKLDIAIKEINEKVKIPAVDAKIKRVNGIFKITPEVIGVKVNISKLMEDIEKEINANLQGPVIIHGEIEEDVPKVRQADLKSIDSKISSYYTSFNTSTLARCKNIRLATESINGIILMPGDIFSFNKVVGKTTADKGYESAKVIVGDEFVEDIGGGVCQVSTTLYNAVIRSELTVIERKNHSLPISYVPLGQDAMIFYGYSDLKVANDTDFPVFIEGSAEDNKVTFNIYSNVDLTGKRYNIESKIVSTAKPEIKVIYDEELTTGEIIVEKEGKPSYIVEVYRTTYMDDLQFKKELVSTSRYKGINKVIRVGK